MHSIRNGVSLFAVASAAIALASCSGGGGAPNVTYSPGPGYPTATAAPTGTSATATAGGGTPTSGATTTPTSGPTTPSGTPSASASAPTSTQSPSAPVSSPSAVGASPTAAPTATTVAANPTQTPTPTSSPTSAGTGPSAAQCSAYAMMNASSSPPMQASITEQLPMNGGTVPLPNFEDTTGSAMTVAYTNNGGTPTNVTIMVGGSNFDNVNTSSTPSSQAIFSYQSLSLDQSSTFSQAQASEVTFTSPCNIISGSTYYVTVYALGTTTQNNAVVDSVNTTTHSLTYHLTVPAPSAPYTFPQNTNADIILSKTTP